MTTPTLWALRETGDGRTIDALAVPFNSTGRPSAADTREVFDPGCMSAEQFIDLPLRWKHREPIGRITDAWTTAEGIHITARIADTQLGRDAVALLREFPNLGASVGMVDDTAQVDPAGLIHITSATPFEVSLTEIPAYPKAAVINRRERTPTVETTPAPVTSEAQTSDSPDLDAAAPTVREVNPDSDLGRGLAELREQVASLAAAGVRPATTPVHELAKYRSFGEAVRGEFNTDGVSLRAWVDQVTTANPGVVPPSWLSQVFGIIGQERRFINAVGTSSPGASGLDVNWPYFDGTLSDLIGEQATQKTEITSALVSLKKGTASLKTYAGGSDVAYQLIERSDPSYLDAYMRIMLNAWAYVTEAAAVAAAEAGKGDSVSYTGTDMKVFFPAVLEAAAKVEDATGALPSAVLVSSTDWVKIAGALDSSGRPLYAAANPSNASGVATSPGALSLSIAGIPLIRSKVPLTSTALVTNGEAFKWFEDGPRTVAAEHVSKLGRDVAVYGYAAAAPILPKGIVTIAKSA